ncbi:TIGR03503 family protein [Vibrio sp. WXL103]|uniref:TIGR03503 family protein n=1 Tax=Vibrio sp. WXL103 TaxID=3450710 RepID=UPI003EC734B5
MKAAVFALIGLFFSSLGLASPTSSVSLLDNRFRVDPSIEQITFVVYREAQTQPVVLVRPDGRKYYAWKQEDGVRWHKESAMDIVSIDNPMPGPWQAVGKVSQQNKVLLISELALEADVLPARLYQGEEIKFTAQLTSDGEPVTERDFLERVNLRVTFTRYVENEQSLDNLAKPLPEVIGEFADDGQGLDEVAGDGSFTVALPITPEPGKYRARITSGNGVFLRAIEQEVLVYPSPIEMLLQQSRNNEEPHRVIIDGENGMVERGSLAVKVEHLDPDENLSHFSASAAEDVAHLDLDIPNLGVIGTYQWRADVFATDMATKRPLTFRFAPRNYSVTEGINLDEMRRVQDAELEAQQKLRQQQLVLDARAQARQRALLWVMIGNMAVVGLGLLIWLVTRRLQARRQLKEAMEIDLPN